MTALGLAVLDETGLWGIQKGGTVWGADRSEGDNYTALNGLRFRYPSGWYYDALGYNRVGKRPVRGVTLYQPDLMLGGVISWLEIADLFRPRVQRSLF